MEVEVLREGRLPPLPPLLTEFVIEIRLPDKGLIEKLLYSTVKKFKDSLDLSKDND